jgi:POT family proton-dependent oligopeptide transporter
MTKYRQAPLATKRMPPGIPYIISNEVAERYSFYGMRAILVVFMTQYLMGRGGELDVMSEEKATEYFHYFVAAVYFTPLLGALLSDIFFGKYRTIIILSLVYFAGHLALAIDDTRLGLAIGLGLIAIGSGGIKPCVSAHVGDQFGESNQRLLSRVYGWFYIAINVGSFTSSLSTPVLLDRYGPAVAFGVPGVFMGLATIVFWAGRHKFAHVPPAGAAFLREAISPVGLRSLLNVGIVFVFVAVFWSLFDQTGSSWVLQAAHLDRNLFRWEVLPSQIQAANPFLVIILVPTFSYLIYPALERVVKLTPLRKISAGLFLTAVAFAIPTFIETRIAAGETPSIGWQLFAYLTLTCAEIMVSVTALEFAYTQAPKTMKSLIMSFYMLSISAGNLFTALVNRFIQNPDDTSKLEGPAYFLFFTGTMFAAAVIFVVVAIFYKGNTYIQEEVNA